MWAEPIDLTVPLSRPGALLRKPASSSVQIARKAALKRLLVDVHPLEQRAHSLVLNAAKRSVRSQALSGTTRLTTSEVAELLKGTDPTWKITLTDQPWADADTLASYYYGLSRLAIARRSAQRLGNDGLHADIADILSLFRCEGDLSVPLSVAALQLQLPPDNPIRSSFPDIEHFLGPMHTCNIRRAASATPEQATLATLILDGVKPREEIILNIARDPISTLKAFGYARELGVFVFLILLGGLDFYIWSLPHAKAPATPEEVFRYQFARNRYMVGHGPSSRTTASDPDEVRNLLRRGRALYLRFSNVEIEQFSTGRYDPSTLLTALYRAGRHSERHVLPIDAIDFGSHLVTEAMWRFEALRREPLIFDSAETFREPLPHGLAYLRYNAWDIYFTLWILDVVDMALNTRPKSRIASERTALQRLRNDLGEFRRAIAPTIWTVLDRWRSDERYVLRLPFIRQRSTSIRAILAEAAHESDDDIARLGLPGKKEREYGKALAVDAEMKSCLPLFHAIRDRGLWSSVAASAMAHVGPKGVPWLGSHALGAFSPKMSGTARATPLGADVGRNARRFFMVHHGYQLAFGSKLSI